MLGKTSTPLLIALALAPACEPDENPTDIAVAESAIVDGYPVSVDGMRAPGVVLYGQHGDPSWRECTGTVIDPWWVLTAKDCLTVDGEMYKDAARLDVTSGLTSYDVTHVALHPDHHQGVEVIMLRLAQPLPYVPYTEVPIWQGSTSAHYGHALFCYGYESFELKAGYFSVLPDSIANPTQNPNNSMYYGLEVPNRFGQNTGPGDIGGGCLRGDELTGVHIDTQRQVSATAWRDWAEKLRDCIPFNPNYPATNFCSSTCPCDVGEGDCDSDAQCQPGLYCRSIAASQSVLPAGYAVCDRIPAAGCGSFNPNQPQTGFCSAECPCMYGEGDCDSDDDCGGSLACQKNSGAAVGLPDHYDICVYPSRAGCPSYHEDAPDDAEACSAECPCDIGRGDCDSDAECLGGLSCVANIGERFGRPANYDMCAYGVIGPVGPVVGP